MSKITVKEFSTNLDKFRVPLSSFEREKRKGLIPYYGAAKIIDYVDGFTHTGLSVLIAEDGSVETKNGYPVVQLANGEYWVNNHTHVLKGGDDIDTTYLYYALQTIKVAPFVTGAVQKKISQQALNSMEIPYFEDKTDRKRIVEILSSFDEKIQLNTQINQTLEQIAQALFKSWFVDFDPVRAKAQALSDGLSLEQAELAAMQAISGKTPEELTALSQAQPDRYAELAETAKAFPCEMVEVDGVEVPKGWEVKALDEIANYQNGLALQKFRPEDDEPFLPVVKIAQLRQGYADDEEKAKASIKPECIIDNGDVIFSWSGSLLVDIWCGGKAALNQHLFKVTSKEYPKWFYHFYTKHHLTEFQRIAYDKAVTMGHIKREHLSAAKCIVPNDELLANKSLENILEKIIFNRLENFNLQNTRDLLLPRLLSGKF
ncbi:restriction endonuclease subunit S [uncultured Haemophilus sp.]|uniref:restriction endonuclease subunit S n=1 Tax=Haemophilus sp. SZY H52 TaxID=3042471 RepID=UPI002619CC7C|nr:restriction endonuclease subunit S [uncultured Haemophilus sp.]